MVEWHSTLSVHTVMGGTLLRQNHHINIGLGHRWPRLGKEGSIVITDVFLVDESFVLPWCRRETCFALLWLKVVNGTTGATDRHLVFCSPC